MGIVEFLTRLGVETLQFGSTSKLEGPVAKGDFASLRSTSADIVGIVFLLDFLEGNPVSIGRFVFVGAHSEEAVVTTAERLAIALE